MGILASAQIASRWSGGDLQQVQSPPRIVRHTRNHNGRFETGPTHKYMTDKNWTKKGIEDSVEGKAKDLKGKVKDGVGGLTGDTGLQAEGKIDQLKGKAQNTLGKVERKIGEKTKP